MSSASVLSQKSAANRLADPVAAEPHGSARLPGRCTAASALRASTGRLRAGVGSPSGATRPIDMVNELLIRDTRSSFINRDITTETQNGHRNTEKNPSATPSVSLWNSVFLWCKGIYETSSQRSALSTQRRACGTQSGWRTVRSVTLCLVLSASGLVLTGCLRRSLTIRTNPPGALVYINDQLKGTSPLTYDFMWYGWHRVTLRKDGYVRLDDRKMLRAPLYLWIPIDLAMELLPFPVRDTRTWSYTLTPAPSVPTPAPPGFNQPASTTTTLPADAGPSARSAASDQAQATTDESSASSTKEPNDAAR